DLHFAGMLAKRRIGPNVQGAGPIFIPPLHFDRVDAVSGHQALDLFQVGSWKTDCSSPLLAPDHGSMQTVRAVKKARGIPNRPACERLADATTRDWLAAQQHRRDDGQRQAGLATKGGEGLDRALAIPTKAKVHSFDERSRGQPIPQNLLKE